MRSIGCMSDFPMALTTCLVPRSCLVVIVPPREWSRVLPRNKELMGMRSDETYIRDSFFHIDQVNLRISIVCLPAFDKEGIPTSRPAGRVCLSCVGD